MIEYNGKNVRAWSMLGASGVLGLAACELAACDPEFAVVTSDLCYFSGLERFKNTYSERFFNVGIAEQNMIGVAAGMAKEGMHVLTTTYATFASTRVLDQIKVNMGYMNLPVKIAGLTSGFAVGILGATHMSTEDIAIMRSIPNMVVLSPADGTETMKALMAAGEMDSPVYIRMSGTQRVPIVYSQDYHFEPGKAVKLRQGEDVALMATGTMVSQAIRAADLLEEKGISCDVIDVHTIKPIDTEMIYGCCGKSLLVSIEEHSRIGGLGAAIAEVLAPVPKKPPHLIMGLPDRYPHAASYEALLQRSGLTADQIFDTILTYWKENF